MYKLHIPPRLLNFASAECEHLQFGKLISVLIACQSPSRLNAENYKLGVVSCVKVYIVQVQTKFSKNEFNIETLQLEGCFAAAETGD